MRLCMGTLELPNEERDYGLNIDSTQIPPRKIALENSSPSSSHPDSSYPDDVTPSQRPTYSRRQTMPSIQAETVMDTEEMAKGLNVTDHPRVVVLGASGVGKTAIVQQFFYDQFPVDHVPTVEEMHNSVYDVSGSSLSLDVLDTSGYYEFPAMRRLAIKTGDAFILVYAIDDLESFKYVSSLRELILEIRQKEGKNVPIVVVGNKCDLEASRKVHKDITESVVTIDWEHGFVEASAKDNHNIVQIFRAVLAQAHICYSLDPAKERRRKSLPAQPTYPKIKHMLEQKRHSCNIQ